MTIQIAMLPFLLGAAPVPAVDIEQQFERWEQRLRSKVAELHVVPASAARGAACDVTIGFAIGDDGRPADPVIRQSDCKKFHDRAALSLVGRLGRIGKVPSAAGVKHSVVLKLSYGMAATSAADRDLSDSLKAERLKHQELNLLKVTASRLSAVSYR